MGIADKRIQRGSNKVIILRLQILSREFVTLTKTSESIDDYLSRIALSVNQIRSLGEKLSNKKVSGKSVDQEFKSQVQWRVEESKDLEQLSFTNLKGSLKIHEQRLNGFVETLDEQAFQCRIDFKEGTGQQN